MLDEAANADGIAPNNPLPNTLAQIFRYFCSAGDTHEQISPRHVAEKNTMTM
ncbi:hypothetical protein PMI41_00505 [Phyllobacterium sp. YR531]|nr:hypothetical protein PMI41_00505 [Phyllobacterium sp. YR531]